MGKLCRPAGLVLTILASAAVTSGCSYSGTVMADHAESYDLDGEILEFDEPLTAADRIYMHSAEDFLVALAKQEYDKAYSLLSREATQRMSLNQFEAASDQATAEQNERQPLVNVSQAEFVDLITRAIKQFGTPRSALDLYIQSTDPDVLSGRGEALDVMFSIGAMPVTIPAEVRRASLRGQVRTALSGSQAVSIARDYDMTVEEVLADEDFAPYFTVKIVLVEEDQSLKVGYFELLPPSIFD